MISRRAFLSRSGLALGGLALAPALAGCSSGGSSADVYFENWPEYIDRPDEDIYGAGGTLATFQEETGLTIKYTEGFNDNNEYFAKVWPYLSRGNPIGPNVIAPTNWMAGRFVQLGWAERLPLDLIPNARNLIPSLRNPPNDPTGAYSLPWQAGIGGIAWNEEATGRPLTSIEDLWDPEFKGRVSVLTELRDTLGLIAMSQGADITQPTWSSMRSAFDKLEEEVRKGQIRQFTGNEYVGPLEDGTIAACIGWSGDVLAMNNPKVKFAVPDSGGTLWFDTMIIPAGAPRVDDVAQWMNFVYDPVNAARITEYVQFISPVEGVQEVLRRQGGDAADLADDPLVFPDPETLARLQVFGNLDDRDEPRFDAEFSRISGT